MLKSLRRTVDSLAEEIEEKISKTEASVLPVARYHGIMSLPSEVIVNIMTLPGGHSLVDHFPRPRVRARLLSLSPLLPSQHDLPLIDHADLCQDTHRQDDHSRGRVFRYHR